MSDSKKKAEEKAANKEQSIEDKCQVIADIVNHLCNEYNEKYSKTAKAFLETVIGAAIFYVYNLNGKDWCEGKIIVSEEAKKQKEFCADHIIPRKEAASLLLKEKELTKNDIYNLLRDKFCRVVYLTKKENSSFIKKEIKDLDTLFSFDSLRGMYEEQGNIILTRITEKEFKKLKTK